MKGRVRYPFIHSLTRTQVLYIFFLLNLLFYPKIFSCIDLSKGGPFCWKKCSYHQSVLHFKGCYLWIFSEKFWFFRTYMLECYDGGLFTSWVFPRIVFFELMCELFFKIFYNFTIFQIIWQNVLIDQNEWQNAWLEREKWCFEWRLFVGKIKTSHEWRSCRSQFKISIIHLLNRASKVSIQ